MAFRCWDSKPAVFEDIRTVTLGNAQNIKITPGWVRVQTGKRKAEEMVACVDITGSTGEALTVFLDARACAELRKAMRNYDRMLADVNDQCKASDTHDGELVSVDQNYDGTLTVYRDQSKRDAGKPREVVS